MLSFMILLFTLILLVLFGHAPLLKALVRHDGLMQAHRAQESVLERTPLRLHSRLWALLYPRGGGRHTHSSTLSQPTCIA